VRILVPRCQPKAFAGEAIDHEAEENASQVRAVDRHWHDLARVATLLGCLCCPLMRSERPFVEMVVPRKIRYLGDGVCGDTLRGDGYVP